MPVRSLFPLTERPSRIAFAGDWHGDAAHACEAIDYAAKHGAEGILHLGDFGIWQGSHGTLYLKSVNARLTKSGLWLGFVDGNHENFDVLETYRVRRLVRPLFSRLVHLPRGLRWKWGDKRWLALGGATSLDVARRIPGRDWWPQEAITEQQAEAVIESGPADYMITHDAPAAAEVPGLEPWMWSETALHTANRHRELLQEVCDQVQPSRLWHGHMHVRYTTEVEFGGVRSVVEGLNDNGGGIRNNITFADIAPSGEVHAYPPASID